VGTLSREQGECGFDHEDAQVEASSGTGARIPARESGLARAYPFPATNVKSNKQGLGQNFSGEAKTAGGADGASSI
jgi:hypothetical protein